MNWSQGGDFTKSLLSLQLQLQTLLEGVGGDETAGLLDALAKLSDTERALIIPVLTRAISKILEGQVRVQSTEDAKLAEFENSLYDSVLSAMNVNAREPVASSDSQNRLAVVPGGKVSENGNAVKFRKPVRISGLIDLSKARETRRSKLSESKVARPPESA